MSLLVVVQRCPAVPTQANSAARTTMSRSASLSTKMALFPPSSSRGRPKRSCTLRATWRPTGVLPVKESRRTRSSLDMASPTGGPPVTSAQVAPGRLLAWAPTSKTLAKILVTATPHSGVVLAPFHTTVSPQTRAMALFQP
ncbi:unnamed protein product, partial [Ixodes pacificus]